MKLTIDAKNLASILKDASIATPRGHSIISSVAHVKLEAEGDTLTATGCDASGFFVMAWCDAQVTHEGAALVDPSLAQIVAGRDGDVTLTLSNEKLVVRGSNIKSDLHTADPETFPIPMQEKEEHAIYVPDDVVDGVGLVLEDANVHWYRSIQITDGFVSALPKATGRVTVAKLEPFEAQAILRDRYLSMGRKIEGENTIRLSFTTATLLGEASKVIMPLDEGSNIPASELQRWLDLPIVHSFYPCDVGRMIRELNLCILFSGEGNPTTFDATLDEKEIQLTSGRTLVGGHTATIPIEGDGGFKFRANAEFWRDALKHIGQEGTAELYEHGGYLHARIHNNRVYHLISPQVQKEA